jgi:hypothetical protein
MLRFPFLPEPLAGNSPPTLPVGTTAPLRPLLPIVVYGPLGRSRLFSRALLDTGADDTVFPLDLAAYVDVKIRPGSSHGIRWRGQSFPLQFGDVELELSDESGSVWRWPTLIGFSAAPIRYPILGQASFLCYFEALFHGDRKQVELETNATFPGLKK